MIGTTYSKHDESGLITLRSKSVGSLSVYDMNLSHANESTKVNVIDWCHLGNGAPV